MVIAKPKQYVRNIILKFGGPRLANRQITLSRQKNIPPVAAFSKKGTLLRLIVPLPYWRTNAERLTSLIAHEFARHGFPPDKSGRLSLAELGRQLAVDARAIELLRLNLVPVPSYLAFLETEFQRLRQSRTKNKNWSVIIMLLRLSQARQLIVDPSFDYRSFQEKCTDSS